MTLQTRHYSQCDICPREAAFAIDHGRKRGVLVSGLYCAACAQKLFADGEFRKADYWAQTRLHAPIPATVRMTAGAEH